MIKPEWCAGCGEEITNDTVLEAGGFTFHGHTCWQAWLDRDTAQEPTRGAPRP